MEDILFSPVSLDQLKAGFSEIIKKELETYFPLSNTINKQPEFLTRKKAAAFLGISLPTLGEWVKAGIIPGHRISSRVRFKKSELEASLIQIQSTKQRV